MYMQIQERMDAIKKKLQSDPSFRQNYSRLVTKDMNSEQQLEAQLTKQVCYNNYDGVSD